MGKQPGNSRGFALLECLICSAILVAMVGGLCVFAQADTASRREGYRQAAIALARAEMACLQEQGGTGELVAGSKDWLGDADMLVQNGGHFAVRAEVQNDAQPGVYRVGITVSWQAHREQGELTFHGCVVQHIYSEPDAWGS